MYLKRSIKLRPAVLKIHLFKSFNRKKKYQGKVSAIINLNDITSEKETYHIEIETEEALFINPVQHWELFLSIQNQ
jgi:hypothetical protein